MLTNIEIGKVEKKLLNNKLKGVEPLNKTQLAKALGVSKQALWCCMKPETKHNSERIDNMVREWLKNGN